MATPSPQLVALIVNNVVNAPQEDVKEIIEALKALPQMQAGAANMRTNNGVKKSRKQVSSKQDGKGPKRPLNSWMAFRSKFRALLAINLRALLTFSKSSTTRCSTHALRKSSRQS